MWFYLIGGVVLVGLLGALAWGLYQSGRNFIWDTLTKIFNAILLSHWFSPHKFTPEEEEARRSSDEHPIPKGLGVKTIQPNDPWKYKPGRDK